MPNMGIDTIQFSIRVLLPCVYIFCFSFIFLNLQIILIAEPEGIFINLGIK